MRQTFTWFISSLTTITIVAAPCWSLDKSVRNLGIDADYLHKKPYNLTGQKIAIGQVEIGRPGKFGFDKIVNWNPNFQLAGIYYQNKIAKANSNLDNHAAMVAAVMISKDKKLRGVAPNAKLYSSAVGALKGSGQPQECLTSQHIAQQNGGDLRAINFSFGESLEQDHQKDYKLDGSSLLTQCIDWSSRVHNTLYVIAGNQGQGGIPIPTDHYNGITTAYTTKQEGIYKKVDFTNLSALPIGVGRSLIKREINFGKRRAINLVAPGGKVSIYDLSGTIQNVSGTSFAAPHITASVALLQEFGDRQLKYKKPNWSLGSRRHEVSKAVLLNSADKLQDNGDGYLLNMTRTIFSKSHYNWLQSEAYHNPEIPVDIQMGIGQLNVLRAYQQFSAGQWKPNNLVSSIGWDYGSVTRNNSRDYSISKPLHKNTYISITLVWDRLTELNDKNANQKYDLGESFNNKGLNNLDIFLMPTKANNISQSICSSVSRVDNLEHIFCTIPKTDYYKIRVQYTKQINRPYQPYALAWWGVSD